MDGHLKDKLSDKNNVKEIYLRSVFGNQRKPGYLDCGTECVLLKLCFLGDFSIEKRRASLSWSQTVHGESQKT